MLAVPSGLDPAGEVILGLERRLCDLQALVAEQTRVMEEAGLQPPSNAAAAHLLTRWRRLEAVATLAREVATPGPVTGEFVARLQEALTFADQAGMTDHALRSLTAGRRP